ncbi:armadillo repeat-containing protein 4-like [Dendronephthya gigantea]|uniref:armadillo repeat-containing protein 4-like n=1 Tax=Dendronephthya gigantea TaxID=151771 RepID=UPI00106C410B|nr:armadillo repeat-containing protein 4-like [Dendronephthya gigantea]
MESSTESEDEDDRKMDRNSTPTGELTSEYWQIQKLIKFVKIGNQTATLIALCALNDFDMRSEACQMAVRDVNGLLVLTNMLRTDHDKCKIATMKLLDPLTEKSKYNRRELIRFGAMHSLIEHIATSDNRDVVGWAATIIANMSQSSLARNILKHHDGIRKLVNLLDYKENDQVRVSYQKRIYYTLSNETLAKNLQVARSATRALWSCCRDSQRCRVAVLKTGGVPYLANLVTLEDEDILVPVTGLIQECCIEKNFRLAVQHTNIIEDVVNHLTRDNLELKTYGALTIFRCAEEKETRDIVYEQDGILPIIDLLSLKERNALAAATGAVWKCAKSEENARRFLHLDMMEMLLKYIHPQYPDEWTEEVQAHAIGAIGELVRVPEGCFELYRCHGCEGLIGMLGHPNRDISINVAKAICNSSLEIGCKEKFKRMDGIRLLWTLLKSYDDEVIINSAWALCVLIDNDETDAENIRSFVGGLEILVNLLKSENLEVLTSVCAVISEVAIDYQNVGIISDYDVVPLLAELTNVEDNRLKRYLAEAIARCGVFGDNARAFRTSGAVYKIVKYLYIEDIPLQEATVRALYQLSRDPANCAIIHKHGGVKLLLEMVGSDDPDLQEAAAGCLANIRRLAVTENTKTPKKSRTASSKSSH